MSMTTPIVDFVRRYAQSGTSRLHMPGHKGQSLLGFEPWDITEIKGADELYGADGIIAQSEANATRLFGTVHTYYSTEGSSQCIRAMLCLALQAAPAAGQRPVLLAARNAHKALLYAAALLDFDIQWLWPAPQDAGALCSCPVSAAKLTGALQGLAQQGKRPFGVYITSPDYLGGVQDIAALAEVCKDFGVPLLVDNAHGAYLRFLPQGGQHPIALGAAMCCDSGHKTLPVVTGGAYLHLDKCNQILSEGYPLRLLQCCGHLTRLRRELNEAAAAKHCPGPLALESEPLKVTLDAAVLGLSGTELAEKLRAAKIECEYADPRYLVLMFTPDNPPQDFERLSAAVLRIAEELAGPVTLPEETAGEFAELERGLHRRCTIRQAVFAPQEQLPAEQAVGRICAMPTVSCPPAIPIVVSGEQITPAAAAWMKRYHVEEVSVIREPQ